MYIRRSAGPRPAETLRSPAGSGFRFEAQAFGRRVTGADRDALERAARATSDIATMPDALAASAAAGGQWVAVEPG